MNKKSNKLRFMICTVCALVLLIAFGVVSTSCNNQNEQSKPSEQNTQAKTEESKESSTSSTAATEQDANAGKAFVIGNSITKHEKCSYWWQECGMAASTLEKDFVHVLQSNLSKKQEYSIDCFNLSAWESTAHDRYQTLQLLDTYLSPDLTLVVIQLGENMNDISTAKTDFEDLIHYVQDKCKQADIIVVGNFWSNDGLDNIKEQVAADTGAVFVSLKEIQSDNYYRAGMGTVVYDEDGGEHIIEHSGVAAHPGDKGMEAIADIIYEAYCEID